MNLVIQSDLFGMVKWPPTRGLKVTLNHLEGDFFFAFKPLEDLIP